MRLDVTRDWCSVFSGHLVERPERALDAFGENPAGQETGADRLYLVAEPRTERGNLLEPDETILARRMQF